MRVSPMWPNVVPHMCGILIVSRHLASALWMYYITINIHNIHPILDGSMALHVIHNTKQQLFFYEQPFCNKLVQLARVFKNSKMNYESKSRGNILLSLFITYISFSMKVWPFCLFIILNIKSSLMNNLLARYLMQRARVWETLKWIMKENT